MRKEVIEKLVRELAAHPDLLDRFASELESRTSEPKEKHTIPLALFSSTTLAALEVVTLYLHQQGHTLHDSALLLNRSEKALWHTLKAAQHKHPNLLSCEEEPRIPLSEFAKESASPFRAVLRYMSDVLLWRGKDIAAFLKRDPRTISSALAKLNAKRGGVK